MVEEQIQNRSRSTWLEEDVQQPVLEDIKRRAQQQARGAINDWLDVTNFDERYNVNQYYDKQLSSHLEGTCEWIHSHPAYRAWISDNSSDETARLLWICAPAGYGKTILGARLVEHFRCMQLFLVAYFFASPHAQSGGEPTSIIRSWIAQIAQLDSNILELIRGHSEAQGPEARCRASESDIWSIFGSIVSQNCDYAFVLDGFDEYDRLDDVRTKFLQRLKKAIKGTATRLLILSRDETDIKAELSPQIVEHAGLVILQCKVSREDVRHDISLFSKSIVDKKLPKKDNYFRQNLAEQLTEKCEGMFLWVKLQQDQLRGGKNPKQLQNIVKNMPLGLTKTYERNWKIIQRHSPEEQNRALAILRWAAFALRPLTVSEITEALVVEPNNDASLCYDELPDTIDDEYIDGEIIDICGSLVETRTEKPGDGAGSRTIHLIHPSVREFLLSVLLQNPDDLAESSSNSKQVPSQAENHNYIATICLSYLNYDDIWQCSEVQEDRERRHPFLHYTARYWNSHVTLAGKEDAKVTSLANKFFWPDNENFHQWRRYIESCEVTADEIQEKERAAGSQLYYAVLFNLTPSIKWIWEKSVAQLNVVGGKYGTPLQAASFKGHEGAFNLLIGWGADPNIEGGEFGVPINAAIAGGRKSMVEVLLSRDTNLTLQDSMGRTPLYTAAKHGHHEIVDMLIKAGAELKTKNRYRWTPLNAASKNGYLEVVKLLLENGADVTVANDDGWTPLNSASSNGHLEVVKLLLDRGADVTVASNTGWTPLNLASDSGYLEVVKLFLKNGADVTVANNSGWTPLNSASSNGHLEVVKLLLDKGADVAVASNTGWTPLSSASDNGYLEVVKLFLENGADVTVVNNNGWTPLNLASASGHLEVVKLLLKNGANVAVANNDGWTPLDLASSNGHLEVVKLLLDKGADMAVASNTGWTPLNSASDSGYLEVVKLFLKNGADVTVADNDGWTPLNSASSSGHLEVVKLLLEDEADVTVADNDGWTPLNLASSSGHIEVVKLLLKNGADVTVANNYGWTPLNSASSRGHLEVVKLFLEKGTDVNCLGGPHGSFLNTLAFMGFTELLRLAYEQYHASRQLQDFHGRTALHLAARGGHLDAFNYLLNLGLNPAAKDRRGASIFHYASSGGSVELLRSIVSRDLTPPSHDKQWSPLHWACRTGNRDVIELLTKEGVHSACMTTLQPNRSWSPLSIALFHGNGKTVEQLPASFRSLLSPGDETYRESHGDVVSLSGSRHGNYWCNGCYHVSYYIARSS